jgi:threonine/homoserine/homoserine lactone efflux protein
MSLVQAQPLRRPVWPAVIIAFGLSLTLLWMMLLVFGLSSLIQYAVYALDLNHWASAMLNSLFST